MYLVDVSKPNVRYVKTQRVVYDENGKHMCEIYKTNRTFKIS